MYASDSFVVHFPVVKLIEFFTQIYSLSRKIIFYGMSELAGNKKVVVKLDLKAFSQVSQLFTHHTLYMYLRFDGKH